MPVTADVLTRLLLSEGVIRTRSVVEMGNQTYSVERAALKRAIDTLGAAHGAQYTEKLSALMEKKSARHPYEEGVPHVREFYEAFGFSPYTSIDIEKSYGSMVMDLNKDLATEYNFTEQFDLVTNIGVSEHLFNQATFFKNAHALAKAGGYMLHILPSMGHVNHCFFNYHPRFFDDLARANGYKVHMLAMAERDSVHVNLLEPSPVTVRYPFHMHFLPKNRTGSLLIIALLQKQNDAPFVPPIQGRYVDELAHTGITEYTQASGATALFAPKSVYVDAGATSFLGKVKRHATDRSFKIVRRIGRFLLTVAK